MAALDQALATAHAQLLQAREELARQASRSFQDAFLEALRRPSSSSSRGETKWRRPDLRAFLSGYFPQYVQQPTAFSALCAALVKKEAGKERAEQDEELVSVTFDILKRVLLRQYGSTRLVAKDPFPLEPVSDNASDDATPVPVLREFQAEILKKSKSWLGRWRARHLLLRWGVLEMHKRSLTSSSSSSAAAASSRAGDGSTSASSQANAGAAAANTKTYELQDLVSLKLEHVSDGESASTRKPALTLKFQTTLTQASNSHSNPSTAASQDIKTLVLGGGEASDTLVSIRDHIATFALYLELSRRDRLPSMTKVRRYITAGAIVNVRVRIPRISQSKDSKDASRRRSQVKQPPRGMVTALQLAFLQDPRVPSFEIQADDGARWNLLMYFCWLGDLDGVKQLLVVTGAVASGAVDPRSYDALGNTALHLAIQLRAPVALVARLIQVYRHSSPTGGLDGRAGRRGSNDTPLSLALKGGQQEVVALLLASGASPSGSGCQWGQAFIEKRETQNEEAVEEKGVIGDEDSALHVAIKTGMELAAAALIAHKADIYAVDVRGASSLALAVRYGLYALAAALVEQHQKKQNQAVNKQWLFLTFLLSAEASVAAQVLVCPMGSRAETPLHAALAAGAAENALLLLYSSRELQLRSPAVGPLFLRYGQDLNLWTEASCPQNPLMLALEAENATAFRALVRGGARTRALMPRARVGILQLALHFNSSSVEYLSPVDVPTQLADARVPPPLRITVPRPPLESVPLETAQYLRALPRPPTLSPPTLEYLQDEERATLTLVAQEARSEAQDWLAKRIGQKKLLSDAHAQLQNAKKHRRTASGSSAGVSGQSDHQLLEDLKAAAAKMFIDKHVAEAVVEARLSIEREKQTIFQETGLYPGMTSASKKHKKKGDERHRSLL
uniref:Uncharacterized protein n=1 Tax=Phytophthora ramorum TaxID=164328 RepID=H3HAZ8_PHYRM